MKKEYEMDDSFRSYYITGAIGGFRNPYDFRLAFYNIDTTKFILDTQEFKEDENLTEEERFDKLKNTEMSHKILCEIIMSEQAVREIYTFLGKELEELEKLKK